MMDEEMEETVVELTYTAVEIDLDYEYEAARFFDFSREETVAEAREAELWFESAGTYPPSPFVRRLIMREESLQEPGNTSPKCNDAVTMDLHDSEADAGMTVQGSSLLEMSEIDCDVMEGTLGVIQSDCLKKLQNQPNHFPSGLTFCNSMTKDKLKTKPKFSIRPNFVRPSTLMKPTASQMAKQNQPHKVVIDTRNLPTPFGVEYQAAKRQRLDGGFVHKVPDWKQQNNFVHKAPKRGEVTDGLHAYLKLTIPREPELETAQRAQRTRPKNTLEPERTTTVRRFKALPLNRKILEAPSLLLPKRTIPRLPEFQEFHLKTSERAMQHLSSVPSSSGFSGSTDKVVNERSTNPFAESTTGESRRSNFADVSNGCEYVHSFKARPLNKKIFTSKGEIGVFRNKKKDTTVPLEFHLHTDRRNQHHPPVDLFDKLSLAEFETNAIRQGKPSRPFSINPKGPKENRMEYLQSQPEIKSYSREKQQKLWRKQPQGVNNVEITICGSAYGINSRSSSMR